MLLVAALYFGQQVYDIIFVHDNVANLSLIHISAGKAAWQMAHAAVKFLGRVDGGVVVTKYGHVKGTIPGVDCCEAGHPVPDENGLSLIHI